MSIVQLKKRFAEMETYLHKDREGVRRLSLIKDEVHALRTSLAAAIEAEQRAVAIKEAARERADVAEVELERLKLEMHTLRQQMGNVLKDLDSVTKPDVVSEAVDDDDDTMTRGYTAEIKSVVKSLRRKSQVCPQSFRRSSKLLEESLFFDRDDIVSGWTHENLWVLGASVALLAYIGGQVVIFSKHRLMDTTAVGDAVADDASMKRHLAHWFGENNSDVRSDMLTGGLFPAPTQSLPLV